MADRDARGRLLPVPIGERFWKFVDKAGPDGCWVWTGSKRHGYGQVRVNEKPARAHRVAWELLRGPIPEGLTLDHLCRNPSCVRPDHLEPVTHATNVRRGAHGHGLGYVRQTPSGKWQAQVSYGDHENPATTRTFPSEAEARAWAEQETLIRRATMGLPLFGDPAQR